MRITITKTLDIYPAYEALMGVVAEDKGYEGGDLNEFVIKYFKSKEKQNLVEEIEPSVRGYFGKAQKQNAEAVSKALDAGINVEVTIEQ